MSRNRPQHDRDTCRAFLQNLLPDTREELHEALAPDGWDDSPLADHAFPPPDEQEQQARSFMDEMNERLQESGNEAMDEDVQERLFEHMHQRGAAPDVGGTGACDVIGMALWDVFSDNHDVIDPDGVAYHLGSFRGSARFIADTLNETYDLGERYTYLDFYMGASVGEGDEAFLPVYEWIFRRLYERDCDWIYAFPRLHLISFDSPEDESDDPAAYDPAASVERDLEREENEQEIEELREELDRLHEEAVERAKDEPLPLVVRAYRTVFGELPDGWPHKDG
jgi:hypothetical protein